MNYDTSNSSRNLQRARFFGHEVAPAKPKTLAEKLRALRAAEREEGREPVDDFCRRGESSTRFAYFD